MISNGGELLQAAPIKDIGIPKTGKKKSLGCFKYFDSAVAVRNSAEQEFGYHVNHGRG